MEGFDFVLAEDLGWHDLLVVDETVMLVIVFRDILGGFQGEVGDYVEVEGFVLGEFVSYAFFIHEDTDGMRGIGANQTGINCRGDQLGLDILLAHHRLLQYLLRIGHKERILNIDNLRLGLLDAINAPNPELDTVELGGKLEPPNGIPEVADPTLLLLDQGHPQHGRHFGQDVDVQGREFGDPDCVALAGDADYVQFVGLFTTDILQVVAVVDLG